MPVNQSKLKADTRGRRKARENCESWLVLVLLLIGWKSGANVLGKPIAWCRNQNQDKCHVLSTFWAKLRYPREAKTMKITTETVCDTHVFLSSEGKEPWQHTLCNKPQFCQCMTEFKIEVSFFSMVSVDSFIQQALLHKMINWLEAKPHAVSGWFQWKFHVHSCWPKATRSPYSCFATFGASKTCVC